MSILKFFSSANYLPVNLCVARELGLETAVLLGELVSEHEFWESQGKLRADGYFYATVEKIEARTTLSKRKQLAAVQLAFGKAVPQLAVDLVVGFQCFGAVGHAVML